MYQNAMLSVFPAVIIRLVTTLIILHVLMITVLSRMYFALHTVIRISAGEFFNALIIGQSFFRNFVMEL